MSNRSTVVFISQSILSLAHKSSCGNLADILFAGKAPEDWRTPGRFAYFKNHRVTRSVLDYGGPPPLFPEPNQIVPMVTATLAVHSQRRLKEILPSRHRRFDFRRA